MIDHPELLPEGRLCPLRFRAVATFSATVSLPFNDLPRATAALRGWLRLYATEAGGSPDWYTMTVAAEPSEVDSHSRTWFCWSATVVNVSETADSGRLRSR